jgi:hypothetical protein
MASYHGSMIVTRSVRSLIVLSALFLAPPHRALAQADPARFELAGQIAWVRASEFDSGDAAFGGRVGWRPFDEMGVEAEVNVYPGDFPGERGFSRGRVEALFGPTAGPRLGLVRPFAKVRPGFVRFRPSSEAFACILIFPPPLACELAGGRTVFAVDLGGGVDVFAGRRALVRVDVGDRLLRYPGAVFDRQRIARDQGFFSHELRLAAAAGVRF